MRYLQIRFGKSHKDKSWYLPYDVVIETAGEKLGLSKSEIKRLDKQDGVHIGLIEVKDER